MRFLIVSDIHANLEALNAVLDDAKGSYDEILCLGDLVGYGADPNEIVDWARANVRAIVRGNHDKAGAGEEPLYVYNPAARMALEWTQSALTQQSIAYLLSLPRGPLRLVNGNPEGFDLSHGSPVDEDEYLISIADASLLRPDLETRLTFFGHTHIQGGFVLSRRNTVKIAPRGVLQLGPDDFYLLNPGSVGQPRDHNPHAAYAFFDPGASTVEFCRVSYNIEKAAQKILAAGLPEHLAARLFQGM